MFKGIDETWSVCAPLSRISIKTPNIKTNYLIDETVNTAKDAKLCP